MIIETKVKTVINIDIEPDEAFRILCETLKMSSVLSEDDEFFVKQDERGKNSVYCTCKGYDKKWDDRGDLFIALRNVKKNMFSNLYFRDEDGCDWLSSL